MMIALFRKELRHVLPWVLLILGIEVLGNLLVAVRYAPDTIVWARWTPMFRGERAFSCSLVLTVWAMLLAFQVFPYEKDEQTIDFLYSLPLRRRSIFLAKYGTAAAILLTAIVAEEATRWFISGANPHPLTGQTFRFSWAAIDTTLCALLALFVLQSFGEPCAHIWT
jgi:hypothetical protein